MVRVAKFIVYPVECSLNGELAAARLQALRNGAVVGREIAISVGNDRVKLRATWLAQYSNVTHHMTVPV
ncbi:MAG: hypothetical protein ACI89D_000121 [Bermanella sp.]